MGRGLWAGLVALGLLAACSSGGGSAAKTTTTSTTTSTTAPTTTTTSPEDAVREAYVGYWAMVDRLLAAPDANDPEPAQRALDPLLSSLVDQLATKASQGHRITVPEGNTYSHRIDSVSASPDNASLTECFVDGRVEFGPNGEIVDGKTVTKRARATLKLIASSWKVADITVTERSDGVSGCAA
jgi:hypothetical protein